MGISSALEIGKNGLDIYRVATEVTGENIANVNTPGYSRQRVILESAPPTTDNGFPLGTGVKIAAVERYYDALLQKQIVNAETKQGFDSTQSNVVQQIEPTFNEITNDGLGAAINNFFGAWQDLTLNPSGTAERQAVLTRSQILADNFHSVSSTLNDVISNQNSALSPLTDSINATLKSIAKLNGEIKITSLVSGNANEIRDQRDQLIRDLSKQIGITYTENNNGTTDITYTDSGASLVNGSLSGSFSLTKNGTTGFYDVNLTDANGTGTSAVSPTSGQLGATVALRDTIIPNYLSQIDELAYNISTAVNAQHASGRDLTSAIGSNFFNAPTSSSGYAALIKLNISSTNAVAAADALGGAGNSANALRIAQIRTQSMAFSSSTSTVNSFYSDFVSKLGLDIKSINNTVAQDEAFTKQLSTLRESNSGVSLDEELTNMVKYQRSYQASAKLITTATEMMDTVMGLVR